MNARNHSAHDSRGFFAHHGIWSPGVRLFRTLQFTAKAAIVTMAFMPLFGLMIWQSHRTDVDEFASRQAAVRQHVEVAHGVIAAIQEREQRGELSRDAAQAIARETVSRLRYDKVEYFWINDMQPRIVMHPMKKELDGKEAGASRIRTASRCSRASSTPSARTERGSSPTNGPNPAWTLRSTRCRT